MCLLFLLILAQENSYVQMNHSEGEHNYKQVVRD